MNELVVLEQLKPLEIFTPKGTEDILERLTKEAKSVVLDISTSKGRDQIRSLAHKIAKSKTYLDDMGKELVSGWKEQCSLVDAERKRIRDSLDALKAEVRAPLTEWENREEERVNAHEAALLQFDAATRFDTPHPAAADVQKRLDELEALFSRDWQEFSKRAELARDAAHKRLSDVLAASQKYEAEQAELERLRREDADRKQREHDEKLKADAAAKAKAEAEEKARIAAEAEAARVKAEKEKAEQERQRIEREKEAAEARAKKAEDDRKAAEEKAERDRVAAAATAKKDKEEAEARAERDKQAAVLAERERADAEKRAEAAAAAKREADKKHKAKVNNEALNAIVSECNSDSVDITPEIAKAVIEAIAKGLIPHIKISY
jgi:hypothetical protein